MKIRFLPALVGLAIGFALPTFAQQTNTPDPQLREQIVALFGKFTEAWNNNDAAALAALYTKDAVFCGGEAQDRITVARPSRNTLQRGSSYFISATMLSRLISILLIL